MSSDTGERRHALAYLALSAAALVGIALQEGYTDKAVTPLPGDKPTIGFGSTEGVRLGDRTTPPQALARALSDVRKYEGALRQCVGVPLHQHEYDALVSLAYNIGPAAFCKSSLVGKLNALDYAGACAEILRWRFFQGKDCSDPKNRCSGLWLRRQAESRACLGEAP
jgi:lysozyme